MFRWCDSKQRRIDEIVCDQNLSAGTCKRVRDRCMVVRVMNISDEERTKRSERMKNLKKGGDRNAKD